MLISFFQNASSVKKRIEIEIVIEITETELSNEWN